MAKPQDDPPEDLYDRATAQNIRAIWHRLRPPITVFLMAASLFCVVFFSSLHFSAARGPGTGDEDFTAGRGLQFIVEGETAAAKLVDDLQQIPEVGTVRWMGTFLPQQTEQKLKILQGLKGAVAAVNDGSSIGPYDLIENTRDLEVALRVVADEARADEGLRASAHEFRRSLALLTSTTSTPEQTAVELERLLFSGFGELAKTADELSRLAAPQYSDFDPNLRALYVSESDRWRIEALPRRVISAKAFIDAVKVVEDIPLGPLINDQAKLRTLESSFKTAAIFGFVFTLLIALVYLRRYSGLADFGVLLASASADLCSPGRDNRNVDKPRNTSRPDHGPAVWRHLGVASGGPKMATANYNAHHFVACDRHCGNCPAIPAVARAGI